jgi:hypothetical protein
MIPLYRSIEAFHTPAESRKNDTGVMQEKTVLKFPSARRLVERAPLPRIVSTKCVVYSINIQIGVFGASVYDYLDAVS